MTNEELEEQEYLLKALREVPLKGTLGLDKSFLTSTDPDALRTAAESFQEQGQMENNNYEDLLQQRADAAKTLDDELSKQKQTAAVMAERRKLEAERMDNIEKKLNNIIKRTQYEAVSTAMIASAVEDWNRSIDRIKESYEDVAAIYDDFAAIDETDKLQKRQTRLNSMNDAYAQRQISNIMRLEAMRDDVDEASADKREEILKEQAELEKRQLANVSEIYKDKRRIAIENAKNSIDEQIRLSEEFIKDELVRLNTADEYESNSAKRRLQEKRNELEAIDKLLQAQESYREIIKDIQQGHGVSQDNLVKAKVASKILKEYGEKRAVLVRDIARDERQVTFELERQNEERGKRIWEARNESIMSLVQDMAAQQAPPFLQDIAKNEAAIARLSTMPLTGDAEEEDKIFEELIKKEDQRDILRIRAQMEITKEMKKQTEELNKQLGTMSDEDLIRTQIFAGRMQRGDIAAGSIDLTRQSADIRKFLTSSDLYKGALNQNPLGDMSKAYQMQWQIPQAATQTLNLGMSPDFQSSFGKFADSIVAKVTGNVIQYIDDTYAKLDQATKVKKPAPAPVRR